MGNLYIWFAGAMQEGEFSVRQLEGLLFLSKRGFIIFTSQYRNADGGTGTDEFGGKDLNDVIKLIDIVERPDLLKQIAS